MKKEIKYWSNFEERYYTEQEFEQLVENDERTNDRNFEQVYDVIWDELDMREEK